MSKTAQQWYDTFMNHPTAAGRIGIDEIVEVIDDARAGMVPEAVLLGLEKEASALHVRQCVLNQECLDLKAELAKAWEAGAMAQREEMANNAYGGWMHNDDMRDYPLVQPPGGKAK